MTKVCCEGGKMGAGCYHDNCTGPKEIPRTITNLSLEDLQIYAWFLYKNMCQLERERKFSHVSRVEVIGPEGREYVRYFEPEEFMHYVMQDDDRTLKIFIEDCK
jgi:hypothetical protein